MSAGQAIVPKTFAFVIVVAPLTFPSVSGVAFAVPALSAVKAFTRPDVRVKAPVLARATVRPGAEAMYMVFSVAGFSTERMTAFFS